MPGLDMEDTLPDADQAHAALVRALGDLGHGLVVLRLDRIVWANEAFARIVGYDVDEMLAPGFDRWRFVERGEVRSVHNMLEQRRRTGVDTQRFEIWFVRKDGERRLVEASVQPLPEEGLRVLVARDITQQRVAERAFAEQQDLYAAVVRAQDALDIGLGVVEGPRVVWSNAALARILHLSEGSATDSDSLRLLDARQDAGETRPVGSTPEGLAHGRFTTAFTDAEGTDHHLEVAVRGLTAGPGGRRLILVRDTTDAREAEQEVVRLKEHLARGEKLAALGSLVAGVAHELRTPLTYLSNNLELIERRVARTGASDDDLADLLGSSHEAVVRIGALVRDLRRYARLPSDGVSTQARLDDVVRAAVDLFLRTHRGGAHIERNLRSVPPQALDTLQVQQVVLNLLSNSADAVDVGGTVRIITRPTRNGARLVVEDDGPGLAPDIEKRLFEPFVTTKATGTGLGLSIVKSIVDRQGATVRYEPRDPAGARFTVDFPASSSPDPAR